MLEGEDRGGLKRAIADVDDELLVAVVRDLGGHDLGLLLDAFAQAGRGQGSPDRHLRVHDQGMTAADRGPSGQQLGADRRRAVRELAGELGADADEPWAPFPQARRRASGAPRRRSGSCASRCATVSGAAVPTRSAVTTPAPPQPSRRSVCSSTSLVRRRRSPSGSSPSAPTRLLHQPRRLDQPRGEWHLGDRID